MDSNDQNPELKKNLSVEDLNIEILPIIYEIIKSIERDHHDNTAKTRESQDCSQKVLELQKRLDQARAQIKLLSGIDYGKEQQLNHLEALKTQLHLKQELLRKYRYLFILRYLANNEQLVQRLSESYPVRQAARLVVSILYRGKGYIQEKGLDEKLTAQQFRTLIKKMAENMQREITRARESRRNK